MIFEEQANLIARLTLHQSQRSQLIPTLSVLMGKGIAARRLWTAWLSIEHRQSAECVYTSRLSLFEEWLTAIAQHHDLRSLIIQKVAQLVDQPTAQLRASLANASDYQIGLFWQRVSSASDEAFVLRSLLDALPSPATSGQSSANIAVQWVQQAETSTLLQSFATIARLLPPASIPGILVLMSAGTDHTAMQTTLIALSALVEAVPEIPVGLMLTTDQGRWILDKFPESRAKAMLRSGLVAVFSPERSAIIQWLHDRGVSDTERLQPILHLAEKHGATAEMLETALTLVTPQSEPSAAEADAFYRSHQEWLLFQYLESRPTTMGRFQVNAPLDIDFGGHRMEVDFLDAAANIVIELDGHYHFTDLNNYRRDRRKDRLLQQHGFLVLRFLSEDVVSGLEEILDAVDQALIARQKQCSTTERSCASNPHGQEL